jgi:hypothetical protein
VSSEQPVQVGTDLVSLALAQGVALCATGLEEVGTLLCVSCSRRYVSRCLICVVKCSSMNKRSGQPGARGRRRWRELESG